MRAILRTVFTSRVTLLALVLCIVLLSTAQNGSRTDVISVGKSGSKLPLEEIIMRRGQEEDHSARGAVRVRRQNEAEESGIARRSLDQNDGGGSDQQAGAEGSPTTQNVHIHIIAVGDSLTEGVYRAKEATTKLLTASYVEQTKRSLLEKYRTIASGDHIVSVTTQTFGFRGKSAAGVLYETEKRMFSTDSERAQLVPSAIPADLRHVFLNHQDSQTGKETVHRVMLVCSVLAGTNDLMRTKGSTVASTLPSISTEDTMTHLVKLHHVCADYARAMAKRTVAVDSPLHVQVMLLPVSLPPAMLDASTAVHQRLVKSLEGKRGSLRATYGYCTTAEASWRAMLEHRRVVNDFITSPGRFVESLEGVARALRIEDGGAAVGQGDRVFAQDAAATASGTSKAPTRKPIVTIVSKEAVVLDESLLPDDLSMWSDCLHMTAKGYADMGARVAAVIQQQL